MDIQKAAGDQSESLISTAPESQMPDISPPESMKEGDFPKRRRGTSRCSPGFTVREENEYDPTQMGKLARNRVSRRPVRRTLLVTTLLRPWPFLCVRLCPLFTLRSRIRPRFRRRNRLLSQARICLPPTAAKATLHHAPNIAHDASVANHARRMYGNPSLSPTSLLKSDNNSPKLGGHVKEMGELPRLSLGALSLRLHREDSEMTHPPLTAPRDVANARSA